MSRNPAATAPTARTAKGNTSPAAGCCLDQGRIRDAVRPVGTGEIRHDQHDQHGDKRENGVAPHGVREKRLAIFSSTFSYSASLGLGHPPAGPAPAARKCPSSGPDRDGPPRKNINRAGTTKTCSVKKRLSECGADRRAAQQQVHDLRPEQRHAAGHRGRRRRGPSRRPGPSAAPGR